MASNNTEKFSKKDARKIAQYVIDEGRIVFSRHAERRMYDRNYSKADILYILEHGKVTKIQEGDRKQWKYTFKGKDIDGEEGGVVISFVEANVGFIITVLG